MTDWGKSAWAAQATTSAVLLGWAVLWWAAVAIFAIPADFLPPPNAVVARVIELAVTPVGEGPLAVHVWSSLLRFLGGFALAIAIGVPLGFLMGYLRTLDWALNPVFETLRYIPPIAWAPFALLWFGPNFGAQAFVIFVSTLPPVVINAYVAMRSVDIALIQAARVLGARGRTIILEVALPSSVPVLIGGMRIGVAMGWMALIAAEIVAGAGTRAGLGYLILVGQQTLQASTTIAAMLLIGALGWAFDAALRAVEWRSMRWR